MLKILTMLVFEILIVSLCLLIGFSITWSTIKLGISPMPSSKKAYQAMLALTENTGNGAIVDFGCGWGHFVIAAAKKYPQRQIIGYELSLLPWLTVSLIKHALRINNLTIKRENFLSADLSATSVLVCYLYPGAMVAIQQKLESENNPVNFLISNNFAYPAVSADKILRLNDFYKSPVYLYHLKK